jgi:hypothetical protein
MREKTISEYITAKLELISLNIINPGVSHVLDRDRAIETFRELNKAGVLPHPFDIEKWALDSGWSKDEAYNLKEIAQAITDGKKLRKSL